MQESLSMAVEILNSLLKPILVYLPTKNMNLYKKQLPPRRQDKHRLKSPHKLVDI